MSEKRFTCPICNSKDYEIRQRFVHQTMQYEYSFRCLHCGYVVESLGNMKKIYEQCCW